MPLVGKFGFRLRNLQRLVGVFQRHILRLWVKHHIAGGLFLHQLVAAQIEGGAYAESAGASLNRADPFALFGADRAVRGGDVHVGIHRVDSPRQAGHSIHRLVQSVSFRYG